MNNVKKEWIPELTNYCRVSFSIISIAFILHQVYAYFKTYRMISVILIFQDVPFILVGTKMDLRKDKTTKLVPRSAGEAVAQEVANGRYMECSALTQVHRPF